MTITFTIKAQTPDSHSYSVRASGITKIRYPNKTSEPYTFYFGFDHRACASFVEALKGIPGVEAHKPVSSYCATLFVNWDASKISTEIEN